MPERIRLNAFDMTCVAHQSFGLWRHPEDQSHRYLTPGTFAEFIDLVVPELQRRGRVRNDDDEGTTLREKIYETGRSRLRDDHPGAVHRLPR